MEDQDLETASRSGRTLIIALAVLVVAVGGYFALGMPGMDHGSSAGSMTTMDHTRTPALRRLAPAAFRTRAQDPAAFVVNVHTPYEGEIDGTDASIPYDGIVGDTRLPTDKTAEILLYCRSGRMSEIAGDALLAAGYTNVADLDGGMLAWQAAGLPVRTDG